MANKIQNKQLLKMGADQIWEERQEQFHKHGRTIEDDIENNPNLELVRGAICILLAKFFGYEGTIDDLYPERWNRNFIEKMFDKPNDEVIAIAGALLAAQIDVNQFYNEYKGIPPLQEMKLPVEGTVDENKYTIEIPNPTNLWSSGDEMKYWKPDPDGDMQAEEFDGPSY